MADINDIVSSDDVQRIINLNNALQGTVKQIGAVNVENEKLQKQLDEAAKATTELTVKSTAYTQILNATEKEQVKINATAKQMQSQQQQLIDIEAKLAVAHSAENKALIAKRIALQEATKAEKNKLKVDQAEEGSLTRMRQKLSELTKAYDDSGKRTKAAAKEIANLSREIQTAENETNRFQRGVGDYKQGILSLSQGFATGQIGLKGFTAGLKSLAIGLKSIPIIGWVAAAVGALGAMGGALIKNAKEFGTATASLKAITDASAEDIDFMKQKAKEYARESTLSAIEVLTAFEKIGSAAPELLKNKEALVEVTKSAITLSEASGGKLAIEDAAKATTAAMGLFKIPLTESSRVINALAAGSQMGSSEVDGLAESFKTGAATMKGSNMDLEQSIAALETLSNVTGGLIQGADAGTAMKSLLLSLKKEGKGFASGQFELKDALIQVNNEMNAIQDPIKKAAYEQKVFGSYGITAGNILRDNIPMYDELTLAVTGTNTAYEMAAIQTDTLANSNKKFKNAWSSLMLSIEDGGGVLSQIWKGFIDGMTAAFNGISKFIDKFKSKEALERKAAKVAEKEREAEAKATEEMAKKQAEIDAEENKELEKNTAKQKAAAEERRRQQEKGFKLAANMAEKGAELNKKALDKQRKDEEDFAKFEDDLLKEGFEKDKAVAEASTEFMLGEAEREYRRKVMLINATSKSEEEANKKIYELDVQSAQASIDTMNNAMNSINASEEEKWVYKEKIAAAQMDLDEMVADHEVATAEEAAEKKKKLQESIYEASMSVANSLFDFMDSKYAGELTALEQKNEAGLLSEKEYAAQKAELELKQAKLTRTRGIFDATINTATAIIKALADPGGIPGVILSIAAGITGGLQIASILSTPLPTVPAFGIGTNNSPAEFIAGEKGRELALLNTGQMVMFDQPTYVNDPKFKGSHIFTNAQTEAMISRTQQPNYSGNSTMSDERIVKGLANIQRTIDKKPVQIVDSRNEIIGTQSGNHREYNQKRYQRP